jgi:hypothetical protein
MALPQELRDRESPPIPEADEEVIELSEEELYALIDTSARKGLGITGEEYLRRLREGSIERTGPNGYLAYLSMLASLLD